jgi:hypothetical protein
MNERIINDLAVKSGLAEDMGRGYKFPDNYLDFAQLIVKECAKFLEENSGYDNSNNAWHPEPEDLLQHFGVEE